MINAVQQRRDTVRRQICAAGAQIIGEAQGDDGAQRQFYQYHAIPGVLIRVYDLGKITVGVTDRSLLSPADRQLVIRLRRLLAPFLPPR